MFESIQKYTDPEAYAAKQKLKFGLVVVCGLFYTLWLCVVEVQFLIGGKEARARVVEDDRVQYQDGTESRTEKLPGVALREGEIAIDYLPGVGRARRHGYRAWMPFAILAVCVLTGLLMIVPVIREAQEFAQGKRRPRH